MASTCLLLAFASLALAQTDIKVDDWFNKDQIDYEPPAVWTAASLSDRYAKTSTFANATGASATFKFTGTGIQYVGYADFLPANITTNLVAILDGETIPIPGNLGLDHANQQVLFSKQGLDYGLHTITIKKVGTQASGADINIDAFVYQIPDNSPTQTQGGQSTGSPDSGSGANVAAIAGGVVGGVAAGGIIAFLVWYILRKRRTGKSDIPPIEATSQHFDPYSPHPNATSLADMSSIHTGFVDPTTMPGYGSYSTVPIPFVHSAPASSFSSHSKSGPINTIVASSPIQVYPSPQSAGSSSGQGSAFHQPSFSVSSGASHGQSGSHGPPGSLEPGSVPALPPLRQLPAVPPTPSEATGPNRIMSPQPPPPYAPS